MLQQSQAQYVALEKKYSKAKKLLRDYQQREKDMVSLLFKFLSQILQIGIKYHNGLNAEWKHQIYRRKLKIDSGDIGPTQNGTAKTYQMI